MPGTVSPLIHGGKRSLRVERVQSGEGGRRMTETRMGHQGLRERDTSQSGEWVCGEVI